MVTGWFELIFVSSDPEGSLCNFVTIVLMVLSRSLKLTYYESPESKSKNDIDLLYPQIFKYS